MTTNTGGIASQEFRDGAAYGAWELARRLRVLASLGVDSPPLSIIDTMAGSVRHDMGGAQPHDVDDFDLLTPAQKARRI